MRKNHSLDYLIIGHVAKDIIPNRAILGGTCCYAPMTARNLGQSTTFENIYRDNIRHQKWLASADRLSLDHVPPAWRSVPIVHLVPLAQEMSPAMCGDFPGSLLCVTIQGWLRGRDEHCNVIYDPHPELEPWLASIDVLVLSLEDVFGDRALLTHLLTTARLGIETLGPAGQPEIEVDPTGADDIFAAAFLVRYIATGDYAKAAQFSNACASLSVRKRGVAGIPSHPEVEAHLAELYAS